ncbi:hypothetical protein Emed_001552 [Eimeria media]
MLLLLSVCLMSLFFLLSFEKYLFFVDASGPTPSDPLSHNSSLISSNTSSSNSISSSSSSSSSSSRRASSRNQVHQVVVSTAQEISDGGRIARLEISLQAPSQGGTETQKGSALESNNLVKGFLTATLRGPQLEVHPPLFDGDPRTLATMLDVVLKEAEALGAVTILSSQDASNKAAVLAHAYAGFLPVLSGGVSQQDSSSKVLWVADAARRRRHQQRVKHRGSRMHAIENRMQKTPPPLLQQKTRSPPPQHPCYCCCCSAAVAAELYAFYPHT